MLRQEPSIRRTFFIPLMIVAVGFGGLLTLMTFLSSVASIREQARIEAERLNRDVLERIESLFSQAEAILNHNAALIGKGSMDAANDRVLRDVFFSQASSFTAPTSIYFGNLAGGLVGAGHEGRRENFYEIHTDGFKAGQFTKREVSSDGEPGKPVVSLPNYDARTRAWFKRAVDSQANITWGDPYVLFTGQDLAIAPSRPVFGRDGKVIGAVGMDIFVSAISSLLKSEPPIEGMTTYLLERKSGLLIAASDGSSVFERAGEPPAYRRLLGTESRNPTVVASADWIKDRAADNTFRFYSGFVVGASDINRFVVAASAVRKSTHPDWLVVSVVPESIISRPLWRQLQWLIALMVLGAAITAITIAHIAKKMTAPIRELVSAIDRNELQTVLRGSENELHEIAVLKDALVLADSRSTSSADNLKAEIDRHKLTNEALIQARNVAETANRSKSEFLASMSHELRTPMNAVLGFAQLLKFAPGTSLQDKQIEYIDHIISGGTHLNKLLDDVLDLSRIEAGRISLFIRDFELQGIIVECFQMVRILADQNGIALHDKTAGLPPIKLTTDRSRLKQVIVNLLTNAIKYNKPGGSVTVDCTMIEQEYCHLIVRDTGIGIKDVDRDLVFDMFRRLDLDPMVARDGVGIGLSVSRSLIEMLGGHIGVDSEPGVGSTFWIDIPLASNEQALIWTPSLKVGVDAIDADHQNIFALTNVISNRAISDDKLAAALDELIDYTLYHFEREETIMEVCGYADLEAHKKHHAGLIAEFNTIVGDWLIKRSPNTRSRLQAFLRAWWVAHITNVDTTIAEYVAGREMEVKRALQQKGLAENRKRDRFSAL